MNEITEITRCDIFEVLINGYVEESLWGDDEKHFYFYYGRLQEIEFLKKLYPLKKIPSTDNRFANAEEDIWQHTINNDDWDFGWVFHDSRFGLMTGTDSVLLKFICEIFNPVCRIEDSDWKEFFNKINRYLKRDGFELYETRKISGRSVYDWRKLTEIEVITGSFVPFSIRNKPDLEANLIKISISKKLRNEILELMNSSELDITRTSDTGWDYEISIKVAIFEDLKEFYVPKSFNESGKYKETHDFTSFVMDNLPEYVLDAVEIFAQYADERFMFKVNALFGKYSFPYKILDGKFERHEFDIPTPVYVPEKGLKELIDESLLKYKSEKVSDKKEAVEKIWDALERLKSYYKSLNKKKSVEKLIADISSHETNYIEIFNDEFIKLTKIGNDFRIRHHETNKIEITDNHYFNYFFLRCYALISLAINYLEEE
ncbi:AbiJ-related protein [Lactococcus lactis]|uniref:AbiJ-related protein n=1 Tax=Lactococcus lactis TaxID=1358 RepID=UPI00223C01C9|nr:hypothetical protein [Lactococcus lactis]MCT0449642.1 hypothetical protein [Lactococcus lactis subsp. lactis]